MVFPDSPRVVYQRNPLMEVACGCRFPPILKIDVEPPATFQDAIRGDYPLYGEATTPALPLPPGIPQEIARLVQTLGGGAAAGRRHEFSSDEKRIWSVTLTRETIQLRTARYRRWEEFRDKFVRLYEALHRAYQPASCLQLSLRYVDVINRAGLGLKDCNWADLLKPHLAGLFSVSETADRIDGASGQAHIRLDDGNYLTLKYGLVSQSGEQCFSVDGEFHTHGKEEHCDVFKILDEFHREAGRLFRWCIQERLHNALVPEPTECGK